MLVDAQFIRAQLLGADQVHHPLDMPPDLLAVGLLDRFHANQTLPFDIDEEQHASVDASHLGPGPVDPEAHEACLKGRHFWHQRTTESVRKGLSYFEEAARLDPGYAPAHTGIADSNIVDGGRYLGVTPEEAYTRAREAMVRDQLAARDIDDAAVLDAMGAVSRHEFVPTVLRSRARAMAQSLMSGQVKH